MGYQRDKRIEAQARDRKARCAGCADLTVNEISYIEHTCGQVSYPAPRGASDALICGSGPWNWRPGKHEP